MKKGASRETVGGDTSTSGKGKRKKFARTRRQRTTGGSKISKREQVTTSAERVTTKTHDSNDKSSSLKRKKKKRAGGATTRRTKVNASKEPVSKDRTIGDKTEMSQGTEGRSKISTMSKASSKLVGVSKEQRKSAVLPFIESTLRKGVKGLQAEFRDMKRTNNWALMKEFTANQPDGRNRYKDVGCLDESRVILTIGPVNYVHANYVRTTIEKKFICTQAPLVKTLEQFWYMIVQEKVFVILMLCNFVEMGAKKCEVYFPDQVDGTITFGEITITTKKRENFTPQNVESKTKMIYSEFEVSIASVDGGKPYACRHYHWMDWPDRGVPEADLFPIHLMNYFKKQPSPIVVHCSAGIGRTGSVVLIDHALDLIASATVLQDMKESLEELRKQRNNSIQTDHQYLYVHQVLLNYMRTAGLAEDYTEQIDKFTDAYKKATT